jgi:hypothetical protein
MSKVKITGHASGSGTLTLSAPNTSSDRTITLPDATGTLLNSDGSGASLTSLPAAQVSGTHTSFTSTGIDDNADATAITIDSSENVGIGVVPETWHSGYTGLQVGALSEMGHKSTPTVHRMGNAYHDGSNYKHIITGVATQYSMEDGNHVFRTVASGSADANITWTDQLEMKADGRGLSQFTAKVWCRYTGNGTPTFYDSHNCDSITDNGTGNYTINFTVAMANDNYSHFVNNRDDNTNATLAIAHSTGTFDVNGMQVLHQDIGGNSGGASGNIDSDDCSVLVFGD